MRALLVPVAFVLMSSAAAAQRQPDLVLPRTNPSGTITQRVGVTDIAVTYNRPSAKGRRIFGALVPYGQVWRTGSDEATTIAFGTDVTVEGVPVPAGTYELFTIPGPTEWTVIVHRHKGQWGSYAYDAANDVARVTVAPVALDAPVETFTVGFDAVAARSATMSLSWERTRVPVTIAVDVVAQVVPRIAAAMQGEGRKPYFLAAMFYFENGLDLEKAAEWIGAAVTEAPDHIGMLHRQALILEKKGDRAGALAAAQKSLDGAARAPAELRAEYTRLNTALIERLAHPR
jgi:hypothetical protein